MVKTIEEKPKFIEIKDEFIKDSKTGKITWKQYYRSGDEYILFHTMEDAPVIFLETEKKIDYLHKFSKVNEEEFLLKTEKHVS